MTVSIELKQGRLNIIEDLPAYIQGYTEPADIFVFVV